METASVMKQLAVSGSRNTGDLFQRSGIMPQKTGGRRAGTPNRRTATIEEKLAALGLRSVRRIAAGRASLCGHGGINA